ncbi:MAG: TonB-dependent receptor [Gammaproteobacteria bacterium]|nr:TonB-dependent receptor [Gammaproteobacteria bacterium]
MLISKLRHIGGRSVLFILSSLALTLAAAPAAAQEDDDDIEEITVTGTQIKGAAISGALPVSIISVADIEAYGIDSGDELLDLMPENGNNFFNEAESISGGVNSARGDVGAFNLRSMGTGNTLVLLNGRRLVLAPQYQTEEIGGSFVPVNTVNSNTIPVFGIERVEVLREGASAIYGADAVAGVVNTVLRSDLEGFAIRTKFSEYDHVPRNDTNVTLEWGKNFNGGATNVGVFVNYLDRGRVNSQDEARWADADFRYRIPEGSPWEGNTSFRNNSANSIYGQYDVRTSASGQGLSGTLTDRSGEFETYPAGDPRCQWDLGYGTCGGIDGQGTYRHNLNENRDLNSDLQRASAFVYINHEMENGVESFTELAAYDYDSNLFRHASAPFSSVKLRVGAENYWNPFGPCGSPNRLPASVIPDVTCDGLELEIDNYRFTQVPRIVDNAGDSFRVLQGFRGSEGAWDWETALTWSRARADDVTHNRVSNTLMAEALFDPTPAAYNPFSGGVNSNIERALIDVYRKSESELRMLDFKMSNAEMFDLPAGPMGFLAGVEYREESFVDNRDPRLDGRIVFTDYQGDTYPYVSDVVNSSPTPSSRGSRSVISIFSEVAVPVFENLDLQLAVRYEDLSDTGTTTVPKVALGWQVFEPLLLRASWSEGFRAPNLVTVNEEIVARQNTRTDWACTYAAENGGDPDQDTLDCRNSTQRIAQGSDSLRPEESENFSVGLVLEPIQDMTITLDYWGIEKKDTIGLFGEENHTLLDLYLRREAGTSNCAAVDGNTAVVRDPAGDDESAIYLAAGICPAGDIQFINDQYANLDTRTIKGVDLGWYYDVDTAVGSFNFRLVASHLLEYEQDAGGDSLTLVQARDSGLIPANYPIAGFADLIGMDGNQEYRANFTLAYNKDDLGASVTAFYIGDFYQDSLTLEDPDNSGQLLRYTIPSMTTYNAKFDYTFRPSDNYSLRTRLGVNNFTDERAPLADRYFGYFADSHRDLGRYYYLDLKLQF